MNDPKLMRIEKLLEGLGDDEAIRRLEGGQVIVLPVPGQEDLRVKVSAVMQRDVSLPAPQEVEDWEDVEEAGRRGGSPILDLEVGWEAYRRELAETCGNVLPVWGKLPEQVRECWAVGVSAAVEGEK